MLRNVGLYSNKEVRALIRVAVKAGYNRDYFCPYNALVVSFMQLKNVAVKVKFFCCSPY